MDRVTHRSCLAFLSVVCAATVSHAGESTGFWLEVEVTKAEYSRHEPVIIHATVHNPDRVEVPISGSGFFRLELWARFEQEEPRRLLWGGVTDCGPIRVTTEERLWSFQMPYYDPIRKEYYFDRKGKYVIVGAITVPGEVRIESEPKSIVVVEPSEFDKQFLSEFGLENLLLVMRSGAGKYCPGRDNLACESLKMLVRRHMRSSYAPQVFWRIHTSGQGRQVHLNEFVRRWPDHGLTPVAEKYLDWSGYP